jgi:predicted RNA polymerase sigma factor
MSGSDEENVHRAVERVARESYGRLVAYLSVHTRDLAAAEDALSDALLKALTVWPRDGVLQNPGAWLLTTARHSLLDFLRHQRVVLASEPNLLLLTRDTPEATLETSFPDERLKLLFACAHPAIDPAMHTPLMLQTVLGLVNNPFYNYLTPDLFPGALRNRGPYRWHRCWSPIHTTAVCMRSAHREPASATTP